MEDSAITSALKELGTSLKSIRTKKGIKRYPIMKKEGVQFDTINAIEDGRRSYTMETLLKYCDVAGITLFAVDNRLKNEYELWHADMCSKMEPHPNQDETE